MTKETDALERIVRQTFEDVVSPINRKLEDISLKIEHDESFNRESGQNHSGRDPMMRFSAMMAFRLPMPFSGIFGESFKEWLENFKQFMLLQGFINEDDEYKSAYLEANLGGTALASYREIKRRNNAQLDFDGIVELLSDAFPEGRDSDVRQQLIYDRRQKYGESVTEYLENLKN